VAKIFPRTRNEVRSKWGSSVEPGSERATARASSSVIGSSPHSIVVAGLEKLDTVLEDFVDESVGLIDPARPHVATEILERLRLAETLEGVAQHGLHEVEHA
jgi:hypothetical protein